MINYVKFLRGTPTAFSKIAVKDTDTLYFISEPGATVGKLYLGEKLISGAADISNSSLNDFKDVVIDKDTLVDGSILMFDQATETWVNKTLEEVVVGVMVGATTSEAGEAGMVPQPKAGDNELFLRGDATWAKPNAQEIADLQAITGALIEGIEKNENDQLPSIKDVIVGEISKALIEGGADESLDTLQEIAAWIKNHPEDASELNKDVQDLKTSVGNIEDILNGITDEDGEVVEEGLLAKVDGLLPPTGDSYVLTSVYNSQVGDINDLVFSNEENTTIIDEINSINQRLQWVDIEE